MKVTTFYFISFTVDGPWVDFIAGFYSNTAVNILSFGACIFTLSFGHVVKVELLDYRQCVCSV